ncbi:SixA phosphatase family protein [Nocardioides daejeonensis]|uniref:SixA phosphatase family protein n=1 Tax=Nocardioides daejeonensis TaxID=1046556 RepID=UPI000D74DB0A|nr:histidine phosphatase family protein [Nocardioides daejeonensis]
MEMRRTLVIVRHAKAEAFAPEDHARVLSARGEADAYRLGAELALRGVEPTAAVVSDAARTRGTWAQIRAGAEENGATWSPVVDFSRAVYSSDPETLLQLVREVDAEAPALMVVGHNPTVATLALLLDDGDGDPAAARAMAGGYPTAAYAVFSVPGEWRDLDFGGARLDVFGVARAG